jgi:hypothetical protein
MQSQTPGGLTYELLRDCKSMFFWGNGKIKRESHVLTAFVEWG